MTDKLLLEVCDSKNIELIKKNIYETFKDYDKDNDPHYLYLIDEENIEINTLTVPLCRAYIKYLIDEDSKNFKNTSIENGTIHKILRRIKTIYDINFLLSNKKDNNSFFEIMNYHGWYDRDYAEKLKYKNDNKKINPDIELLHIDEADFSYLCTLLTMLIRENNAYLDMWNKKRIPSGAVDKILTKMVSLILIGAYFDEEDELLDI